MQDAITIEQKGPGRFEVPNFDHASQKKVRDALLMLAETVPDTKRMFGARDQVDPVRHPIGTAMGFGGNPRRTPSTSRLRRARETVHRLTVKDVPVDGFWSISVYNAQGHFEPNPYEAYTLNNITAKTSEDGSIPVQFGGCDGTMANCAGRWCGFITSEGQRSSRSRKGSKR